MSDFDAIVIGSGIGGLVAGSLLARYGRQVLILESHSIPGGAAHGFSREGFCFDSGPSFYCGLSHPQSLNPLRQVLAVLGESLNTVPREVYLFIAIATAIAMRSQNLQLPEPRN